MHAFPAVKYICDHLLFACFPKMLFGMLSKDVVCMLSQNKNIFLPSKYIENINKNIFNCYTNTLFFQNLSSPAPTPESRNAPVVHRLGLGGMGDCANS